MSPLKAFLPKWLLVFLFFLFPATGFASKAAWLDSACRRDACLHFAASYGLSFTGAELLTKKAGLTPLHSLLYSSAAVLALGFAKELFVDEKWDGRDVSANLLGVTAAAGMFYIIEF